jgi:hypothetical protein
VVGRVVKLGSVTATIVGVMPEGFGFPRRERIWTPLRVDGSALAARSGPAVSVFGRLAPNVSIDEARAELRVIGSRMAASYPQTHGHLSPRVTAYATPLTEGGERLVLRRILYIVNGVFLMLLGVGLGERGDARVRAHGHPRLGDHGSNGARRQPWPHHFTAIHRGAGPAPALRRWSGSFSLGCLSAGD